MPLDPAVVRAIMQSIQGQVVPAGGIVPFRNPNEISAPLPVPNQGYMPTPAEAEFIRKYLERGTVIPFPGGNK